MTNLSHLFIIDEILEKNHLLQDLVSEFGEDVPTPVLKGIDDLDWSMRQFGSYWKVRDRLVNEGAIV